MIVTRPAVEAGERPAGLSLPPADRLSLARAFDELFIFYLRISMSRHGAEFNPQLLHDIGIEPALVQEIFRRSRRAVGCCRGGCPSALAREPLPSGRGGSAPLSLIWIVRSERVVLENTHVRNFRVTTKSLPIHQRVKTDSILQESSKIHNSILGMPNK